MKIILGGLRKLELDLDSRTLKDLIPEAKKLRVLYCGICRTDAKMWEEGHRELKFPRVPGHEVIVEDEKGRRFVVWPGRVCGQCKPCRSGRENLCEEMEIMGFHFDGGFADFLQAPENNLIPFPESIPPYLGAFAEPTGCVINAVEKLDLARGERIIIYGGGTTGLITALVCLEKGAMPFLVEKNEEKISKIEPFLSSLGIECAKDTAQSEFDTVLVACPDLVAFSLGLVKLRKGGRYSFFSSLKKNEKIETNLLNLIHYKEASMYGAYGLTRDHMKRAIPLIGKWSNAFELLVEDIVAPVEVPSLMGQVLSGKHLKYVIQLDKVDRPRADRSKKKDKGKKEPSAQLISLFSSCYTDILHSIKHVDRSIEPAAQAKIDNKTKPLGALGQLEQLAVQLCLIQETLEPKVERKHLFVFAGDHGVVEEGVSAYPSEVTQQMVLNFLNEGAAINVFCRHYGIDMSVVDMGVKGEFEDHPLLLKKKVAPGTRNFALEKAMSTDQAKAALQNGMDVFLHAFNSQPFQVMGLGDMGIGNTTAATAIICAVTGIAPKEIVGRGTGIDDKGLEHKAEIISKALEYHRPVSDDGLDILSKVGGFEIAGIAGAALAAASRKVAVVLDGVISTAGGLIAYLINPAVGQYFIAGHRSVERAQEAALRFMGLRPLLDLDMRLGEGTGAAIAINLVELAAKVMNEMASFDEAGVSKKI